MEKVDEVRLNKFPYLNMEFFWNVERCLESRVYQKPNQQLKYLEKGSTHASYTFAAIPHGIFKRLARLTSRNERNGQ